MLGGVNIEWYIFITVSRINFVTDNQYFNILMIQFIEYYQIGYSFASVAVCISLWGLYDLVFSSTPLYNRKLY